VTGHSDIVWRVEFINDDTQVINCWFDKTTRIWDAALGRQVCQLVGQHLAPVEGLSDEHTLVRHILTARDDTFLIYDFAQERQRQQRPWRASRRRSPSPPCGATARRSALGATEGRCVFCRRRP
jgi:WD40 repeat protein